MLSYLLDFRVILFAAIIAVAVLSYFVVNLSQEHLKLREDFLDIKKDIDKRKDDLDPLYFLNKLHDTHGEIFGETNSNIEELSSEETDDNEDNEDNDTAEDN